MGSKGKDRDYTPGERIPGTEYIVLRLVARGGHGALYRVRHHFLEKKILMLKTLRAVDPNKDLVERLKREAQVLAGMEHPHIVSVVSGGLTDEPSPRPYFVMERLKGDSLARILPVARSGVGMDTALRIGSELADALHYVHSVHGIVHRDIKPDNIFIQLTDSGSNTKLLDFGIMHMLQIDKRYTKERLFLGTFRYASPEQLFGEPPVPQTDLYALGLVLYELLTGHHPFEDCTTIQEFGKAQIERRPPPFPTFSDAPPELEDLVLSMLAKKPKDRPRNANVVKFELGQIAHREQVGHEAFVAASLHQTDPTPFENHLTMTRGEPTDPGPHPEASPAPTAPSGRTLLVHDTVESAPPFAPDGSAREPTAEDSPIGFQPTQPSPRPARAAPPTVDTPPAAAFQKTLESAAPVDRSARTHSQDVKLPTPKPRTDTDVLAALVREARTQEASHPRPSPDEPPSTTGASLQNGTSVTPVPTRSTLTGSRRLVGPTLAGVGLGLVLVTLWTLYQPAELAPVRAAGRSQASVAAPVAPTATAPPPAIVSEVATPSPSVPEPGTAAQPSPAAPRSTKASDAPTPRPGAPAESLPRPKDDVMRDSLLPNRERPPAAPTLTPPSTQRKLPGSGL